MITGDTIAAISTPVGEGGLAVLRISGPDSSRILDHVFRRSKGGNLVPRVATFGQIVFGENVVDEVLATTFLNPSSYTGEDMVEISCHGGIFLAAHILEIVLRAGARAAEPGEFTHRAFLNGKLDLTRAEAVMDLIRARTPLALRAAAEQLQGRLGHAVSELRVDILAALAHIEAWIDFPEEGISPAVGAELRAQLAQCQSQIVRLLATAGEGRLLREGVRVAIAGKPNAGKSSLLNCLLGMDRAIVSPVPGTTRDTIEESICLRGILFRFTDTAGLRESEDPVERAGVERAQAALDKADLVLHVVDISAGHSPMPLPGISRENQILIANKYDLVPMGTPTPDGAIAICARDGTGLDNLVGELLARTSTAHLTTAPSLVAVNARHHVLLEKALAALVEADALIAGSEAAELIALEVREALDAVGQIIGATNTEEILGEIFSKFCIGK